jgi:hypothetical protein
MARGAGRATRNRGSGFVRFAKRDPIPLALVGVGLAWLIADGVRHRANSNGHSTRLRAKAHTAVDTLADAAEHATDRVTDEAGAMGHRLTDTMRSRPLTTAAASLAGVAALGAITYAVMPNNR